MVDSIHFNRVQFLSTTSGLSSFGVGAAFTGFRTPAQASVPDGTVVSYVAEKHDDLTQWEVGQGTYNSGTLSRTTIRASTNGGAAVNFSVPPRITFDLEAEDIVTVEAAQDSVGTILLDSATIDFTYNDVTPSITAIVKDLSVTYAKIQNVSAASKLLGRGDSGLGEPQEITLGTNLSMSGTTLNAAGGGGGSPGGASLTVQYNNAGAFGGMSGSSWDDANRKLTLASGTIITSKPIIELTQTWNDGAVTFTGAKMSITDTAGASGSIYFSFEATGPEWGGTGSTWLRLMQNTGSGPGIWMHDGFSSCSFRLAAATASMGHPGGDVWSAHFGLNGLCDSGNFSGAQVNSTGFIGWSEVTGAGNSGDTAWWREGTGIIAQRNKTTGAAATTQKYRLYHAWTDASNYERAALQAGSGYIELAAETAGTGTDNLDVRLTPAGTGNVVLDGLAFITSDAGFDVIVGWDDSGTAYKNMLLADILTEAAPAAGDFVLIYGAEGDLRKVNWSGLPGGGSTNAFGTIVVAGQSDVVADAAPDTLTLVAGTNISITTNAGTDTITISASAGGGGGDVTGAASSTDNAIVRFDGTTGKIIQNSTAILTDAGDLTLIRDDASTNTVLELLTLRRTSSSTPAAGIGASLRFEVETSSGNNEIGVVLSAIATDVTSTDEHFDLLFSTMADGAAAVEKWRMKSLGYFLMTAEGGSTPHLYSSDTITPVFQMPGTSASGAAIATSRWAATATGSGFHLAKSRGASVGTHTIVQANDFLGNVFFNGSDGVRFIEAAKISAASDGTPGVDDMPGRLMFFTTADAAATPTERLRIDSAGRIIVGGVAAISTWDDSSFTPTIQVLGTTSDATIFGVARFSAAAANAPPRFFMGRSRGTTIGDYTAVTSGDVLSTWSFLGSDGTDLSTGANINAVVDGTVAAGDVPTRLTFGTKAAAGSFAERLRIDSSGNINIGGAAGNALFLGFPVKFEVDADPNTFWHFRNAAFGANAFGITNVFTKTRGAAQDTHTIVDAGDGILNYVGYGSDGAAFRAAGRFTLEVDGTPGASDMPGRWIFLTTPDGSVTPLERLRIDQAGRVNIGGAAGNVDTTAKLEIDGDTNSVSHLTCLGFGNNAFGGQNKFRKTRGANASTHAIVNSGDELGFWGFQGSDGATYRLAAGIAAHVDGTPGTSDMPGRLVFSTTADGAVTLTERLRIKSDGTWGVNANAQGIVWSDAGFDVLFGWDDSAVTYKSLLLADILTEAAPAAGDFLMLYGAEGDLRKVNWSSLPGGGGSGDVVGPASATDNAIARYDGTTGKLLQNSGVRISDTAHLWVNRVNQGPLDGVVSASVPSVGMTAFEGTAYGNSVIVNYSMQKARGTEGAETIIGATDTIGSLEARGFDGSDFRVAAEINFVMDGTPGANDMPGRIQFHTTPDGSDTHQERVRIDNAGMMTLRSGGASVGHVNATVAVTTHQLCGGL